MATISPLDPLDALLSDSRVDALTKEEIRRYRDYQKNIAFLMSVEQALGEITKSHVSEIPMERYVQIKKEPLLLHLPETPTQKKIGKLQARIREERIRLMDNH